MFSLEIEDLADQRLTRGSTHHNLGRSSRTELLVGLGLLHLVVVLSLSVNSLQVYLFCLTFLKEGIVFGLGLLVLCACLNTHDCNLLLSLDEEPLGLCLGLIDQRNCIGLNLVYNNVLLTSGLSQHD